jgi:hypothetical protein
MLSITIVAVSLSCMLGAVVYATGKSEPPASVHQPETTQPRSDKPQLWAAAAALDPIAVR